MPADPIPPFPQLRMAVGCYVTIYKQQTTRSWMDAHRRVHRPSPAAHAPSYGPSRRHRPHSLHAKQGASRVCLGCFVLFTNYRYVQLRTRDFYPMTIELTHHLTDLKNARNIFKSLVTPTAKCTEWGEHKTLFILKMFGNMYSFDTVAGWYSFPWPLPVNHWQLLECFERLPYDHDPIG